MIAATTTAASCAGSVTVPLTNHLSWLPGHLSWSSVKCYSDCPKKFEFRYIKRMPADFVPAPLAFGSAFHSAVESLHEALIEGRPLPETPQLLQRYDEAWKTETANAPEVVFAKKDNPVSMREQASRMLTVYRDHLSAEKTSKQIISIEHHQQFNLTAETPPIEMHADLIELAGQDLIVTDVKTSRSRWNEAKVQEALPQIILYCVGLVGLMRDIGAKRVVPQFCVVSKAKTPIVQVLQPQASQDDVERLKRQVSETWQAIQAGVFIERQSWQCAQCPYNRQCQGR